MYDFLLKKYWSMESGGIREPGRQHLQEQHVWRILFSCKAHASAHLNVTRF
jgi:hypothetical protein